MTGAELLAGSAGALAGIALAMLTGTAAPTSGPAPSAGERSGREDAGRPPAGFGAVARRVLRRRPLPPGLVLAGAGGLVGAMLLGWLGVLAGGAVAMAIHRATVAAARQRALRGRERGVGDLARAIADALRAGRSIRTALHAAASDGAVPAGLRQSVATIDSALQRGAGLPDALHALGERGGPQLTVLCATIALHAERGGALVAALDALGEEADRAVRLDEERAAATAQARATVRTVAALPLLALAGGQLVGGDLIGAVARRPAALALLLTGLALEGCAVLVARRLVARAL